MFETPIFLAQDAAGAVVPGYSFRDSGSSTPDFSALAGVSSALPEKMMLYMIIALIGVCFMSSIIIAWNREHREVSIVVAIVMNACAFTFTTYNPFLGVSAVVMLAPLSLIFVALLRPAASRNGPASAHD